MRRQTGLATIVIAALLGCGLLGTGVAEAAPPSVRIGTVPALPDGARLTAPLGADVRLSLDITLKPRDADALAAAALSAAGAERHGHRLGRDRLTVAGFRARFAPTATQVAQLRAALARIGLRSGPVSANGLVLGISASAGRLDQALHIHLTQVRLANGHFAYTDLTTPRLSTPDAALIQSVIGLDDLTLPHALGLERAPRLDISRSVFSGAIAAATSPTPGVPANDAGVTGNDVSNPAEDPAVGDCPDADVDSQDYGSNTASQIAGDYGFDSLYAHGDEGAGETVALMEFEPFSSSDIETYATCYGIGGSGGPAVSTVAVHDGHASGAGTGPGQGEAALDIEQVLGLAPAASVVVYEAPNSYTGLINAYTAMVDNPAVDVISTSWGECESAAGLATAQAESTIFQEAAVQGESVFASAGDSGSSDCDGESGTVSDPSAPAVDDPGSQPYVTSVGGTEMPTGEPAAQSTWNESAGGLGAGGGGISTFWAMPSYQTDAPTTLDVIGPYSSSTPCATRVTSGDCREVPDVSADADPRTGYDVFYDGAWTAFGGTSAAAPLWAALTALANASPSCAGHTIGFANPALYGVADDRTRYASDFTDITTGTNDYTPAGYGGGLFPAGVGFDMATGLGTPNATGLVPDLCATATASGSAFKTVAIDDPVNGAVNAPTAGNSSTSISDAPTGSSGSVPTTGSNGSTSSGSSGGSGTSGVSDSGAGTSTDAPSSSSGSATGTGGSGASSPATGTSTGPTCASRTVSVHRGTVTLEVSPRRRHATLDTSLVSARGCSGAVLHLQGHLSTSVPRGDGSRQTLAIQLLAGRRVIATLRTLSNLSPKTATDVNVAVGRYATETLTLRLRASAGGSGHTTFTLSHITLVLS